MSTTSSARFSWYLVLASRDPVGAGARRGRGWGGDRYQSYRSNVGGTEQECVRLARHGDTALDTDELEAATTGGRPAMPDGVEPGSSAATTPSSMSACATGQAPSSGDLAMQEAYDAPLGAHRRACGTSPVARSRPTVLTRCVAGCAGRRRRGTAAALRRPGATRKEQRSLEDRATDGYIDECR